MANIYRIQWVMTDDSGADNVTGFHIQTDVPPLGDEPDPSDVLDGFDGHYTSYLTPCIPDTVELVALQLRQLVSPGSSDVPVAAEKSLSGNGQGEGAAGTVSTSVCQILGLTTNAALRAARGYMALPSPFYAEQMADENHVSGSQVSALNAFGSQIETSFDLGSVSVTHANPVVYSRRRDALSLDPFTFRITGHKVNTRVMWRRSRVSIP